MAEIVNPDPAGPCAGAQRLEGAVQVARLDGAPFFVVKAGP
jgi:hypothetical protein